MSVLALPTGASAHVCSHEQVQKVRVFERGGGYRACLRGHRSYRLGLVEPDQTRVAGTMLAYTSRVEGDDSIAALDLADGTRWLRGRPAGGLITGLRLRGLGALMWATDTGGVYLASSEAEPYFHWLDGTYLVTHGNVAKAGQGDVPATNLHITKRPLGDDECGASFDVGFHWDVTPGSGTSAHYETFDGDGCR